MRRCLLATLVGLGALSASAAQPAAEEAACAEEVTSPRVAACLQRLAVAEDAALALALDEALARWRDRDAAEQVLRRAAALQAAQRAWEAYRQQECDARALAVAPGTGAAAAQARCMRALAAQRREDVRQVWR